MSIVFTASLSHRYSQSVLHVLREEYDATTVSPEGKVPNGVVVLWQTRGGEDPPKLPDHATVIKLPCDKTAKEQAIEIAESLGLEKK